MYSDDVLSDPRTLPINKFRFIQLRQNSVSTLNNSWVYVSNFTGVERFAPTELCRLAVMNSSSPAAVISDPLYELPATIMGINENRLELPGVLNCYKVHHTPLQSEGGSDVLIRKYNSTRGLLWALRAIMLA